MTAHHDPRNELPSYQQWLSDTAAALELKGFL